MKRRKALSRSYWALTSAVFGTSLLTTIQGCQTGIQDEAVRTLNGRQLNLVKALADTILPKTESPAASEVGVPQCIDLLLHEVFEPEAVSDFISGLTKFDQECQAKTGEEYISLPQSKRHEYLKAKDEQIIGSIHTDGIPFYLTFKKLCIDIYFATEEGIKQNLAYNPIPGGYQGDVLLKPNDRIEVGNEM